MDKLVIDGKIGSLEKVRKESTDGVEEKGKIRISTEDGSVTVVGDVEVLNSYKPDAQVTVTITRTNKTIKEAIKND